jgi:hypothetical protein
VASDHNVLRLVCVVVYELRGGWGQVFWLCGWKGGGRRKNVEGYRHIIYYVYLLNRKSGYMYQSGCYSVASCLLSVYVYGIARVYSLVNLSVSDVGF